MKNPDSAGITIVVEDAQAHPITQEKKRDIYGASRAVMLDWYGEQLAQSGACLYWTQIAMRELGLRGYRPLLQAGDMHWRMVDAAHDDGVSATHFGYEFDLSQPFSQDALAKGLLPEVHIWVALPDERCLVDFSTGYLPRVAQAQHGFTWTAEPPPLYVFGMPPADAVYVPKQEAIIFVWRFIAAKLVDEPNMREKILAALPAT